MRVRDYTGPLGVLAAGVFGVSLLCSVSALAMNDLNSHSLTTLEPVNIVELAVDNLGTAAGLTEQAVTAFVPTPTVVPTNTASLTPLPSDTATATFLPSSTPRQPTRTRRPRPVATTIRLLPPSSRTPRPPATSTPPPPADTSPPPTAISPPPTEPPPTEPPATEPPATEPSATEPPIQISNDTPVASP